MANLPECPPSLRAIQHYLKIAVEHEARDIVVAYWCRLHALQVGLKISNKKTPEETKLLMALMDWLEQTKHSLVENEAISNEVAAQAHLENYALKLFTYADTQDRQQNYGMGVVKTFYTAGMIYDVLTTFGELTEEAAQNRKYAKWKAAYIRNCLKNGETPVPGPMPTDDESGGEIPSGSQPKQDNLVTPGTPEVTPSTPPIVPTSFNTPLPDPNTVIKAASQLPPVPYTPDPHPGGFVAYNPDQQPKEPTPAVYGDSSSVQLTPDQIGKAQKYCKWAGSALLYDDIKTATTNLKNALELLQTGRDPGQ